MTKRIVERDPVLMRPGWLLELGRSGTRDPGQQSPPALKSRANAPRTPELKVDLMAIASAKVLLLLEQPELDPEELQGMVEA